MDSCQVPSKNVNFFVNAVIHITILLTIVFSFFFLYVSKLSQQKFKEEITSLINRNMTPMLNKVDANLNIKKALGDINFDRAATYYENTTSVSKAIQNGWLLKVTMLAIAMLIFTVVLILTILKQSCAQCVPITHILKENMILFFFVGMIEVSFFYFIACKYVPAKPSVMMSAIVEALKANFTPKPS